MVTFQCYMSSHGDDEISRWYTSQPPDIRAAIYALLETLRYRPPHLWRRKPYATLRNRICSGLDELRIEEPKGTHHRIFGFFDARKSTFTLLYPFNKSVDPTYAIACPEAQKRKRDVALDAARACRCEFSPAAEFVRFVRRP